MVSPPRLVTIFPTSNSTEQHAPRNAYAVALTNGARRCFRAVDSMSDEEPKLIAIDEETNDQMRAWRSWGSCRLGLFLKLEIRVPAFEHGA
jgi:hypothetical protein